MKPATIQNIKEELVHLPSAKVVEICLRLAKYKKDNKELLAYLLFEAHDEQAFLENVKTAIDDSFSEITTTNAYLMKKNLGKILRTITKFSKHTGSRQSELEMRIRFCKNMKKITIAFKENKALHNMYERQINKINSLILLLHDDLKYDYSQQILML